MTIMSYGGYGFINANKLCEYRVSDEYTKVIIELKSKNVGFSDLEIYDKDVIYNWLLNKNKRFSSNCFYAHCIEKWSIYTYSESNTNFAIYEIVYKDPMPKQFLFE